MRHIKFFLNKILQRVTRLTDEEASELSKGDLQIVEPSDQCNSFLHPQSVGTENAIMFPHPLDWSKQVSMNEYNEIMERMKGNG